MFSDEKLIAIYDKTGGYCFHCGKKLTLNNYGQPGRRGAWEVDHGKPISRGGTDHLNNLHPSCVSCNREKGNMTTTEFRRY